MAGTALATAAQAQDAAPTSSPTAPPVTETPPPTETTPSTATPPTAAEPAADAEAPASQGPLSSSAVEDIIVTGSRIQRSGFSAPTPVSVVGAERLQQRAVTSIGDALNELPAFRATNGPAQQGLQPTNYIGGRILDLRGLGDVRTLTIVDGKRFVPSTTRSTVDTNMIPSILLSRAEVVTGGASAAYGSDAVAGVVNLILDRKFEGVKGSAQMGISRRGDDKDRLLTLAYGTRLGDDFHFLFGGEYQKADGVGNCQTRAWCRTETLNFGRTPGNALIPANNILPDIRPSSISPTGVINPTGYANNQPILGPLGGITFNPDGTPRRFQYGSMVNSLYMVGGENQGQNSYFDALPLKSPTERYSLYARLQWEPADSITAALDVSYGRLEGRHGVPEYKNTGTTIRRDNAFIDLIPIVADPTLNVRQILDANPQIASFNLGRTYSDIGIGRIHSVNKTFRVVASLEGDLGGSWKWDAYYQYGRNDFKATIENQSIVANFRRATDAVRDGSGNIVCRDTLSADPAIRAAAAGCVPLNPFGNNISPGARDYVTATAFQTNLTNEHVVAANLSGSLIDLWAGPLAIAVGGEFRSDKVAGDADPLSKSLAFFAQNGSTIQGKIDVTEGYIEADLPLARDITFLDELSVNGAVRRTHYKRDGAGNSSTVNATTWKVGAIWQPVEWLRFRGTRSRDIRAPNVAELFGPTTQGFSITTDLAKGGQQTNPILRSGSNPNLLPEVADTYTLGVVLQPQGGGALSRLRASVDYFDIKIDGAISTLGGQTIADGCFRGNAQFCSFITRAPNNGDGTLGDILQIVDVQQNVSRVATKGFDVEVGYRQPLGKAGDLDLRVLASIVNELTTELGTTVIERAGQTGLRGGTVPGVPDYTIDATLTWTLEPVMLSVHGRYIPSGYYNAAFIGQEQEGYNIALPNSSNTNAVPDAVYIDIMGMVDVISEGNRKLTFYAGVDNLFDKDPPLIPGANGTGNNLLFNPVGQAFKAGVRFRY